ncbi:MAG: helix-turn-helix domain-containing protein [Nanoarchaeota archaeon]|nr:helix-turn-helix domain-containing protein [Nanoarchaeota archaeon]
MDGKKLKISDCRFYTLGDTLEILRITEERLRKLRDGGELREYRDGLEVVFKAEEVLVLMDGSDDI